MNTPFPDPSIDILRSLVDHALDAITIVDERGTIAFENLKAQRLVGWASGLGRSMFDLVHPQDLPRVSETLSHLFVHGEPERDVTYRVRHADGHWVSVSSACHAIGVDHGPFAAVHSLDISDSLHLETRLRHAQKLITLGRLTLAMASDFDEALASIRLQLVSVIHDRVEEPSRFAVRSIQKALSDATALVSQLRIFAHTAPVFAERVEVNMLLRDIRRLLTDHIWLSVTTSATRSDVLIDRNGLREALTDLVLCFGNAMPPNSVIAIGSSNVPAAISNRTFGAPAAEYLVVEVQNTASRSTEDEQVHLFEAAGAKPASGPIMLALVILHDVVTYAGGFVEVASNDHLATSVRVFLPLG